MALKTYLGKALNSVLKQYDYEVTRSSWLRETQKQLQESQKQLQELKKYTEEPSCKTSRLPEGAADYLQPNNHRLQDLQTRYTKFSNRVTAPLYWADNVLGPDDILYFRRDRGDHAYVQQVGGQNMSIRDYALTTFYVKSIDKLRLLERLEEDDFFGVVTLCIDNRLISRDLLDSIMEIYFLEKHLSLSIWNGLTILDIGAGYGRLAHRMLGALPNIKKYLCTDAIAISTFVSEYYLRFRGTQDRAKVIPLDEIENLLKDTTVDVAVNIHSFPECSISAIDWWLSLLEEHRVRYLMIAPHGYKLVARGELLLTVDGKDFGEVVERHGYKLLAKEPKYRDPVVQEYAINPTYHYLFELKK